MKRRIFFCATSFIHCTMHCDSKWQRFKNSCRLAHSFCGLFQMSHIPRTFCSDAFSLSFIRQMQRTLKDRGQKSPQPREDVGTGKPPKIGVKTPEKKTSATKPNPLHVTRHPTSHLFIHSCNGVILESVSITRFSSRRLKPLHVNKSAH